MMLFPMDSIHISETWHELAVGLPNTNITPEYMLQLVMTDMVDVLFSKELKVWFFAGFLTTMTIENWKVMHILSGWSLQGGLMRKPLLEEIFQYGYSVNANAFLFNKGCPWLMTLTGGVEWLRPKW